MWDWIEKNIFTKKVLGVAVGVAGVFYPPSLAVTIPLGTFIAGTDFQHGAQAGTPIGQAAKGFTEKAKTADSVKDLIDKVDANDLNAAADTVKALKDLFKQK